jgi:hypothetical protein
MQRFNNLCILKCYTFFYSEFQLKVNIHFTICVCSPVTGAYNRQLVFNFVLQGNPIERDKTYQTDILRCSNVMTLDNIAVRPLPKEQLPSVCKYFILITIIITHLLALMMYKTLL